MNSILETLRRGTGRERLAVVADLFSIVGISAAAVVSTLWSVEWSASPEKIIGPPAVALATLAGLSFVFAITIFLTGTLKEMFGEFPLFFVPLAIFVWCLFGVAALYAIAFAIHLIKSGPW